MRNVKAFTLIELLIVVAIIAILAAIAVPNFLEAQARAKVTRVMADMRSIGIALESYYVDNNKYIPPTAYRAPYGGEWGKWWLRLEAQSSGPQNSISGCGDWLTSPIQYITSIPFDPYMNTYALWSSKEAWGIKFNQASVFYACIYNGPFDFYVVDFDTTLYDIGFQLHSAGPNNFIYHHDPSMVYDPTNGTVSNGDIWYLGKGLGFLGTGNK